MRNHQKRSYESIHKRGFLKTTFFRREGILEKRNRNYDKNERSLNLALRFSRLVTIAGKMI